MKVKEKEEVMIIKLLPKQKVTKEKQLETEERTLQKEMGSRLEIVVTDNNWIVMMKKMIIVLMVVGDRLY